MTKTTPANEPAEAVEARPVRHCDVCGGFDDHPRHRSVWPNLGEAPKPDPQVRVKVVAALRAANVSDEEFAAVIADFDDPTDQLRHMDCCRAAGCSDGSCSSQTAGAEDLRGADLLAHIQSKDS